MLLIFKFRKLLRALYRAGPRPLPARPLLQDEMADISDGPISKFKFKKWYFS